jgi:hypothetical protein
VGGRSPVERRPLQWAPMAHDASREISRFLVAYLIVIGLVLVGFGVSSLQTGTELFDSLLALGGGVAMLVTVAFLRLVTAR